MGTVMRPFVIEDWHAIEDPIESTGQADPDGLMLAERGVAITVEDDKGPVVCGGVIMMNETEGEMWIRMSKRSKPYTALEAIKEGVRIIRESFDNVKLLCRVKQGFRKGEKLVKWLGFDLKYIQDGHGVYKCR